MTDNLNNIIPSYTIREKPPTKSYQNSNSIKIENET